MGGQENTLIYCCVTFYCRLCYCIAQPVLSLTCTRRTYIESTRKNAARLKNFPFAISIFFLAVHCSLILFSSQCAMSAGWEFSADARFALRGANISHDFLILSDVSHRPLLFLFLLLLLFVVPMPSIFAFRYCSDTILVILVYSLVTCVSFPCHIKSNKSLEAELTKTLCTTIRTDYTDTAAFTWRLKSADYTFMRSHMFNRQQWWHAISYCS